LRASSPGLAQQMEGRLQAAHRQVARLNALNESLLDVSRISAGRLLVEARPTNFTQVVSESIERLEAELQRAGCVLEVELADDVMAQADRLRLEQVVVNLLSNAAKYGPGQPVEIRLRASGGAATLSITDYGIDIAPEALTRIFQKFERAVPAENYGGLGLGLYISRQLVTAMGGDITVESKPGMRTVFTVTLPLDGKDARTLRLGQAELLGEGTADPTPPREAAPDARRT
jgi:signal transduction histidine kinase